MEDLKSRFKIEESQSGFDFLINNITSIEILKYSVGYPSVLIGNNIVDKMTLIFYNKNTRTIIDSVDYVDSNISKAIVGEEVDISKIVYSVYNDRLKNFCFNKCIEIIIDLLEDLKDEKKKIRN